MLGDYSNRERRDFVALNHEMVIECDGAAIERSRHLHCDDDFRRIVCDAERIEMEFVFLDCPRNPLPDRFLSTQGFLQQIRVPPAFLKARLADKPRA